jgi:hypothetical protein
MDFDSNQFLTDVFEALVGLPGDPVRQIDRAVEEVVAGHVKVLRRLAQTHRTDLLDMAEERKRTGKMVATKWRV